MRPLDIQNMPVLPFYVQIREGQILYCRNKIVWQGYVRRHCDENAIFFPVTDISQLTKLSAIVTQ